MTSNLKVRIIRLYSYRDLFPISKDYTKKIIICSALHQLHTFDNLSIKDQKYQQFKTVFFFTKYPSWISFMQPTNSMGCFV